MPKPTLMYGRQHQKGWNKITTIAMVAFHLLGVAALFRLNTGAMLTFSRADPKIFRHREWTPA